MDDTEDNQLKKKDGMGHLAFITSPLLKGGVGDSLSSVLLGHFIHLDTTKQYGLTGTGFFFYSSL